MEIEVPAASPRTFSHITRRGRHILQLETVLIALYYPSALGSGNGKIPADVGDGQESSGFPIQDQRCRKDMETLHSFRHGWY